MLGISTQMLGISHPYAFDCNCPKKSHRRSAPSLLGRVPSKALSDVYLIIERWPKLSSKTAKLMSRRPQRRLSARRCPPIFPRSRCRAIASSPPLPAEITLQPTLPALRIALADMSRRPVPPIRARPTPPTGSIFPPGVAAPAFLPNHRIRKPLGSILPPALRARPNAG